MKKRILILCTGNSCRSQMAQGWLTALGGERVEAFSAGTAPKGVHPLAVKAMAEAGVDISRNPSTHVDAYRGERFDLVATVCDAAREACPVFPGAARTIHRSFDDPAAAAGTEEEKLAVFRRVRDEIRDWVGGLAEATRADGRSAGPG